MIRADGCGSMTCAAGAIQNNFAFAGGQQRKLHRRRGGPDRRRTRGLRWRCGRRFRKVGWRRGWRRDGTRCLNRRRGFRSLHRSGSRDQGRSRPPLKSPQSKRSAHDKKAKQSHRSADVKRPAESSQIDRCGIGQRQWRGQPKVGVQVSTNPSPGQTQSFRRHAPQPAQRPAENVLFRRHGCLASELRRDAFSGGNAIGRGLQPRCSVSCPALLLCPQGCSRGRIAGSRSGRRRD